MSKKQPKKKTLGKSILINFLAIITVGVALVFLVLAFLQIYTRHGHSVAVPNLEGLQVAEASAILRSKGLRAEVVDSVYQRNAVPGAIIEQTPRANNKVKEGRAIYITVFAQNPPQVTIPDLTDYSVRQATSFLNSVGFTQLTIEEVPAQHAGLVISVEYRGRKLTGAERVPAGAPLKLVVSRSMVGDLPEHYDLPSNGNINVPQSTTPTQPAQPPRQGGGIDESFF
ncbi:MAG: PASTA domain-containing protein [Dysgonamonadaceae bacterium]|jgi:beta-lactam-binding protein with PASTA domain|nr:PASTA domain-containing protein [Dysgonamonadaceae bacterium]